MRAVKVARCRGGGSILASFKHHWWELEMECGHTIERNIRWLPIPNPPRGFAALHHPPSMTRLPPPPRRARCDECPEVTA